MRLIFYSMMVCLAFASALDAKPPNVLFLFTDDQRADTIHALGNETIQTPTLDALVARGTTFRNAYCLGSNRGAVCFPSRNMLLSGRVYFKIENNSLASGDKPNFPDAMKSAGYVTYHHGKQGNTARAIHKKFDISKYVKDQEARTCGEPGQQIVDEAIAFLRENEKPFFMYLAFATPHDPRVAAQKYLDRYQRNAIPLPANYLPLHPFDNGEQVVRDELLAGFPRSEDEVRQHLHDYYAVITGLDGHIGRLMDHLNESGAAENTIVIYSSDHGLAVGSHGLFGKQSLYEHSMKPPLIVAGPGIPHGKTDAFVYLHDLFPTVCDLTGVPIPAGLDGKSFADVVRGDTSTHRETIFLSYRNVQKAIRKGDWKLIRYPHIDRSQLFHLGDDPHEMNDLAAKHPDKVSEMMSLLADAQRKNGDTDPLTWQELQSAEFAAPTGDELEAYRRRWKRNN